MIKVTDTIRSVKKRTKKIITLVTILAFVALPVLVVLKVKSALAPKPEMGTNVDSVSWLPSTASEISYYSRGGFGSVKFAVFTISEDDIQAYAEENEWELKPEKDIDLSYMADFIENNQIDYEIKNALFCQDLKPSNSGGTTIAYDLETHRGYFAFSAF